MSVGMEHMSSRCDLALIAKDHMTELMELFSLDTQFRDMYSMSLVTTKCLNTAIVMMRLLIGEKFYEVGESGYSITQMCDVDNLRTRKDNRTSNRHDSFDRFKADITNLDFPDDKRYLYYIMMTHFDVLPCELNGKKFNRHFPGHVFIIEKFKSCGKVGYYMYQSFIQQYSMRELIEQHHGLYINPQDLASFIGTLDRLLNTHKNWDADTAKMWKTLTKTDGEKYIGCNVDDAILFCHNVVELDTKDCTKYLLEYVQGVLKRMESGYTGPNKIRPDAFNKIMHVSKTEDKPMYFEEIKTSMLRLCDKLLNPYKEHYVNHPGTCKYDDEHHKQHSYRQDVRGKPRSSILTRGVPPSTRSTRYTASIPSREKSSLSSGFSGKRVRFSNDISRE
jgi:hypothetical protein